MTQSDFIIKRIDEKCLEAAVSLEKRFFPSVWCTGDSTLSFVCCKGDELVGIICAMTAADTAEILSVATKEEYRRSGIGTRLMNALCKYCAENKIGIINLDVRESNPAINFYKKCGFETVGRRKNYYTAPYEDAVLMTRELKDN